MKALWSGIFKRDLALAFRQRSELAQPLMFLLMVVTLFPLGVGPGPATLQKDLVVRRSAACGLFVQSVRVESTFLCENVMLLRTA